MSLSWLGPLGKVHTNTIAGTHGAPQARPPCPAAYPEPAAPAAPRRPAKILPLATSRLLAEAARRQDMAKGPGSLGESSGRAGPRRREPAPPPASLRPTGLPAPPPGSQCFLAPLSPRAHEPARPRACRFTSSAVERGTHLPVEFSRSLPSSPELLTSSFRVKKEA